MQLLKFGLRAGLIASAVITVLLLVVLPGSYDLFGEGPRTVKMAAQASGKAREVCGELKRFVLIPWELSLEDSGSGGTLDVVYSVSCQTRAETARVEASLFHSGSAWQIKSIELDVGSARFNLVQ
jgi:hypothetical protein